MKKFTVRATGCDNAYEVLGTEVEISDGISSKVFVKEHLSGITGAMPGRK